MDPTVVMIAWFTLGFFSGIIVLGMCKSIVSVHGHKAGPKFVEYRGHVYFLKFQHGVKE